MPHHLHNQHKDVLLEIQFGKLHQEVEDNALGNSTKKLRTMPWETLPRS